MRITDEIVTACTDAYRAEHKIPVVPGAMRAALECFEALRKSQKATGHEAVSGALNAVTLQVNVQGDVE